MAEPEQTLSTGRPGIVVLHWTSANDGLLDELARTMVGAGIDRITCVGERHAESVRQQVAVRHVAVDFARGDELADRLRADVCIGDAHSVIVLPRTGVDDPDSSSRLACAAIRRACGDRMPNVLVEVEDPEAAFEFAGLGVATVFYSGHLRAALLGQACVDLGVFQFVVGLLRGRHRVRSIAVPAELRDGTFADAALTLEHDEHGEPMTVIGITTAQHKVGPHAAVVVNPGPRTPLTDALALMVLVSGSTGAEP